VKQIRKIVFIGISLVLVNALVIGSIIILFNTANAESDTDSSRKDARKNRIETVQVKPAAASVEGAATSLGTILVEADRVEVDHAIRDGEPVRLGEIVVVAVQD